MANSVILVYRTNRKKPYYTKLWKKLRENKGPIFAIENLNAAECLMKR